MCLKPTRRKVDDPPAVLHALLRADFPAFLRKAFPAIRGGAPLAWNWHLDAIAYWLACVRRGDTRRLLVNMPPRNLKSIAISVAWVAWMLGQDPTLNFVCVSYSNELSGKLARDCMSLMQMGWYRELFPSTLISTKRSASGDFETTKGGGRLATSITGTLTGRGGDILIIDDPVKPEEANSDLVREFVNHWFKSTLASRLNDKGTGAIIVVMQRLHQFDLSGMLLEAGGWDHLSLPAIATEDQAIPLTRGRVKQRRIGDILHPAREPRHVLDQLRADMGSSDFAAQYQQDPVPAGGNLVLAHWLKTYSPDCDRSSGRIVQSWDTASKDGAQNDWSVCITAHVHRGDVRVLDVFRARLTFPDLKRNVIRLAHKYRPLILLIEDQASGMQLIQTLRSERPVGVPMPIPQRPEADKLSRMAGVSGMIEAGQLLLPVDAEWLAEFKSELLGFPHTRYKDQVDALSQLMSWAQRDAGRHESSVLDADVILFTFDDGVTRENGEIPDVPQHDDPYRDIDPWSGL